MKSLIAGIVFIVVLGLGAFLYRNVAESPVTSLDDSACTKEAKVCPDGTSVSRSGPSCEFAKCALPNVELPEAGIAFAIPEGYAADENAYGANPEMLAAFVKDSASGNPQHTIIVHRYAIGEGETAEEVMLSHTRFQPSDMPAESIADLKPVLIGGKTYQSAVIERFEALVHSVYYLPRETDVLAFEIIEHDVMGWMEPGLLIPSLPEHSALLKMLTGLQAK